MTITAERPTLWSAMPGWGIAADLTPRELRNARELKVLRNLMAIGIAVLLLIGAVGYYLAAHENSVASADLAAVADRTVELRAVGEDFADVVSIEHSIANAEAQISQEAHKFCSTRQCPRLRRLSPSPGHSQSPTALYLHKR